MKAVGVEVACIVPVKNGELFLSECFDSLLQQSFEETRFEVCVFDDGSSDSTSEIIEHYSSLFSARSIRFHRARSSVPGGVGFAKNNAVLLSSSRFLCFCDADDVNIANRIRDQYQLCMESDAPKNCLVGARFVRLPECSTQRYTEWACSLAQSQLKTQIYTSFGPTLIAPTWFLSRDLYDRIGGFEQTQKKGFPEDLDFFYKALHLGANLLKLETCALVYRHHSGCSTHSVAEETIWDMRVKEIQKRVLDKFDSFTIWNAGRQGKRFFRCLTKENQKKVQAMYDVDEKKINRGSFEVYDEFSRQVIASVPILSYKNCQTPVVLCVKLNLTNGVFERLLSEKSEWQEGIDYFHFS